MTTFTGSVGMVPAADLDRAKSWYADKLGLKPSEEIGEMGAYYEVGSTRFMLYPSQFAGTNQANTIGLRVDDLKAAVAELRESGVEFMEYDFPELKTEDGIATFEEGDTKILSAWCTDSEGNILAIGEGI